MSEPFEEHLGRGAEGAVVATVTDRDSGAGSPAPQARGGRLGALRRPGFGLLFAAQVCSLLGDQFYLVAMPFFVLDRASASGLGNVLLAFGLGRLVFLPVGGFLADRFARPRVILWAYLVKAVLLASLAVVQPHELWVVMALTAILGFTEGASLPATMSILPFVVEPEHLPAANSLMSTATMGISLLGPAAAGAVVSTLGSGFAFGADAVIAVFAIVAMSFVRLSPPRETAPVTLPTPRGNDVERVSTLTQEHF